MAEKVFRRLGLRVKRETKSLKEMKSLRDSRELKTEGEDEKRKSLKELIPLEILAFDPYTYSKA